MHSTYSILFKHLLVRKAKLLMEHGLQKQPHAQKVCTVDSTRGRHNKESESACTETSTAPFRWMDRIISIARSPILTILNQL